MPRKSRTSILPRVVLALGVLALVAFAAGEAWQFARSGRGELLLARWLPGSGSERLVGLASDRIRAALTEAGVPADSVRDLAGVRSGGRHPEQEPPASGESPVAVHWHVGFKADASLMQANYALTQALGHRGVQVLAARERQGPTGRPEVVMRLGVAGRPTHELVLTRPLRLATLPEAQTSARMAVVVYGFSDDAALAKSFLTLPAPFAVAIAPGKGAGDLFRAARDGGREVVLHLPLEPVNYPQVNPGEGAILVSMSATQITTLLRKHLDQAGAIVAVCNLLGSLATQDMSVMTAVYRELHRRRLPFLHMNPAAGAVCKDLAAELGVPYDEPQAVIDYEARVAKPTLLDKRWKSLVTETRARGRTILMVRATPLSRTWLARTLQVKHLKGISLVPLSAMIQRPPE